MSSMRRRICPSRQPSPLLLPLLRDAEQARPGRSQTALRRVERPPYEQLVREIAETSYVAVGRKYGVSDNAIRKWVRQYERERAAEAARAV